jgi:hypothetical protein
MRNRNAAVVWVVGQKGFIFRIAVVLSLGVAFAFASMNGRSKAATPIVRIPPQVHDFGTILPSQKYSATFALENTFAHELVVDQIERSCGCTSVQFQPGPIFPGHKLSIMAVLSSPEYRENISSTISVHAHTSDQRVEAKYELTGNVENIVEFPDTGEGYLELGSWPLTQLPGEAAITVSRGQYPLRFDSIRADCKSPGIIVRVQPLTPDSWRIVFNVNPQHIVGKSGFPVTFRFAQGGNLLPETVTKQAVVELLGPFTVTPSSILVMASKGEHLCSTIVLARRPGDSDVAKPQVTAIESDSKNVIATWQNTPGQSLITVNYVAPENSSGQDTGSILISVMDRGTAYRVRVNYLATIS